MQQNATDEDVETSVEPYKHDAFEGYITWRALGGLIVDEEYDDPESGQIVSNKIRKMPLEEFCKAFNVNRTTVWRWKKNTPDLALRIEKRRMEIVPLARVSVAYNQLFLLGMQSQDKRAAVDALKVFLGHFGNLQLPVQRNQVDVSQNLMDLVNVARKKKIVEAEVVEPDSNA